MSKTDGCVFCRAQANITGEHLWSKWFSNMVGLQIYTVIRKDSEGKERTRQSENLDSQSKVVCGKCNNGWISKLESKTKSVIQDMVASCQQTTLSSRDVTTIAEFTFLKAVIAEHSHNNRSSFFSLPERDTFRKTLQLPAGFQMWLASLPIQHGILKTLYLVAPQNPPRRFEINAFNYGLGHLEINVFTYGLGHLVIQASTCRWTKKRNKQFAPPPRLTQAREWYPISIAAFPVPRDRLLWPPSVHMGRELIDRYAQRWKDVVPGWIEHRRPRD